MCAATASLSILPAFCEEGAIRVAAVVDGKCDFSLSHFTFTSTNVVLDQSLQFNINKHPHQSIAHHYNQYPLWLCRFGTLLF
jgi:hypothetical protein